MFPYLESEILNSACLYSIYWSKEKYNPNIQVMVNPVLQFFNIFELREWCAHVTDAPEEIKIIVFNKGTFKGLNLVIEIGGHTWPNSTLGLKEKWKNLQKNEEKNITSDVINKIIPIFKPLITSSKWYPWNVASRVTSFHHKKAMVASIKLTSTKK